MSGKTPTSFRLVCSRLQKKLPVLPLLNVPVIFFSLALKKKFAKSNEINEISKRFVMVNIEVRQERKTSVVSGSRVLAAVSVCLDLDFV